MEFAALPLAALYPDPAAHQLDQIRGDGQTQTGTAVAARAGSVGLHERIENTGLLGLGNPHTGIGDAYVQQDLHPLCPGADSYLAMIRKPDGVADQVDQDLAQRARIAHQNAADLSGKPHDLAQHLIQG